MESIDQIIPKEYRDRPFLKGQSLKNNYRHVDRFPDHVLGAYEAHTPEPKIVRNITEDEFTELLRAYCKREALKKEWPMVNGVRWQMNPDNKDVLYAMVKTLIQGKKGIYLLGDHGSGKTEMMNAIITVNNNIQHHYDNLSHIYRHTYDVIYDDIRITGHAKIIQNMVKNIYIDDFLYQNRAAAKVFGNSDNVADLVITRCYELHKAGYRIYMTSNYGLNYMTENQYIHKGSADRMREMVDLVKWKGESMR